MVNLMLQSSEVLLAEPRGFCAGVERAISIVNQILKLYGPPIFVRHEIVHNIHVVSDFISKGVIFVDNLNDIPEGSIVIFSAHGISKKVEIEAKLRKLKIFDATCPLVKKVHIEVERMRKNGKKIIMIGHRGHPEVEGTLGQLNDGISLIGSSKDIPSLNYSDGDNLALITQTTLSVDDTAEIVKQLREKFPNIEVPKKNDICYATQNRQNSIKLLIKECDLIIIIGSKNSSNSNRLYEIALNSGINSYLIDDVNCIQDNWLISKKKIGISAGASAPEQLVQTLLNYLKSKGVSKISTIRSSNENISFPLPNKLNLGAGKRI